MPIDLTYKSSGDSFPFDLGFYNQVVHALRQKRAPEALRLLQSAPGALVHHEAKDGVDPLLPGAVTVQDATDWGALAGDDILVEFEMEAPGDGSPRVGHLTGGSGGPYGPVSVPPGGSVSWTWNPDTDLAGLPGDYVPRRWGASFDGRALPAVAEITVRAKIRVRVTTDDPVETVAELPTGDAYGTRRLVFEDGTVYERQYTLKDGADAGASPAPSKTQAEYDALPAGPTAGAEDQSDYEPGWVADTAETWTTAYTRTVSLRVDRSFDPDTVHGLHPDVRPEAEQLALESAGGVTVRLYDTTSLPSRARSAVRDIRVFAVDDAGDEIAGTSVGAVLLDSTTTRDLMRAGVDRGASVDITGLGTYAVETRYKVCYATEDSVDSVGSLPAGENGDVCVVTNGSYDGWAIYTHDGTSWSETNTLDGLVDEEVVRRRIRVTAPTERPVPASAPPSEPVVRVLAGNGDVSVRFGERLQVYAWEKTSSRRDLSRFLYPGTRIASAVQERLTHIKPKGLTANPASNGVLLNAPVPVRVLDSQGLTKPTSGDTVEMSLADAKDILTATETIQAAIARRPGGYVYTYKLTLLPETTGFNEAAALAQTAAAGQVVRLPGSGSSLRITSLLTPSPVEVYSEVDPDLGLVQHYGIEVLAEGLLDPTVPSEDPESMVTGWTSPVADHLTVDVHLRYGQADPGTSDYRETRARVIDPRVQFPEVRELLVAPGAPALAGDRWYVSCRAASAWGSGVFRAVDTGETQAEFVAGETPVVSFSVRDSHAVAVLDVAGRAKSVLRDHRLFGTYAWVDTGAEAAVNSWAVLHAHDPLRPTEFLPRPTRASELVLSYQWRSRGGSTGPVLLARSQAAIGAPTARFGTGSVADQRGFVIEDGDGDARVLMTEDDSVASYTGEYVAAETANGVVTSHSNRAANGTDLYHSALSTTERTVTGYGGLRIKLTAKLTASDTTDAYDGTQGFAAVRLTYRDTTGGQSSTRYRTVAFRITELNGTFVTYESVDTKIVPFGVDDTTVTEVALVGIDKFNDSDPTYYANYTVEVKDLEVVFEKTGTSLSPQAIRLQGPGTSETVLTATTVETGLLTSPVLRLGAATIWVDSSDRLRMRKSDGSVVTVAA